VSFPIEDLDTNAGVEVWGKRSYCEYVRSLTLIRNEERRHYLMGS